MSRYTYDSTNEELNIIAGIPAMDTEPIEDSVKPITSGGVYSSIQTLANKINNHIIVIGNSYVDRGCATQIEELFTAHHHFTGSGIGFVTYSGQYHDVTFEDELDLAIADTSIDKSTVTCVLFVSAMGDSRAYHEKGDSYTAALNTTMASIKTKIDANYPNCKDIVLTLAESRNVPYFSDSTYTELFVLHRLFLDVSVLYGFRYIGWSGFNILLRSSFFDSDNYHLSSQGSLVVGTWIKSAYMGNAEYYRRISATQNVNFKYTTNSKMTVIVGLLPDIVDIQVRRISTGGSTDPVTITAGQVLIDGNELNVPFPRPGLTPDINTSLRVALDGAQRDWLSLTLTADSNGVGIIQLTNNPSASTAGSGTLVAEGLEHLSYIL